VKFLSAQKLIAFLLIVFLSGTCCLLCCDLKVMAFAVAAESCPMGKKHHCPGSAKKETPGTGLLTGSTNQTKTDCPFISRRGDVAQNVKSEIKFTAVSPSKIASATVLFARPALALGRAYTSPIRDRGGTYLANCVFRI
jgi:hypothetical protein